MLAGNVRKAARAQRADGLLKGAIFMSSFISRAGRFAFRNLTAAAVALPEVLSPAKSLRSAFYHAYGYRMTGRQFRGVHLGCGPLLIPGFCNIDGNRASPCDLVSRVDRLKFRSNSVETIYCSHVFEHVARADARRTLAEWYRVLKPGGKLYMGVPDLEKLCEAYLAALPNFETGEGRAQAELAAGIMYGGQVNRFDFHYAGYSFATLSKMLLDVGFSSARRFESGSLPFTQLRDATFATIDGKQVSLNVEATK